MNFDDQIAPSVLWGSQTMWLHVCQMIVMCGNGGAEASKS